MKRLVEMILQEPYRVFFPLGVLAGIWGVLMWPLFYGGHLLYYPGEAHARIMTCAFIGAFIVGFLGTAFPRLAGARRWMAGEFGVILMCWLFMVWAWSCARVAAGDDAFVLMMALLLGGMAIRWMRGRLDTPPPGFVLVAPGLAGAAISAWCLAHGTVGSVEEWRLAKLWLYQGFLLLPLMGIGPYVLPRFFGMPSSHAFETSISPPSGWWEKAVASSIAGLCVIATFALEAWEHALVAQIARALIIMVWFARETPVFRRTAQRNSPGTAVRWSVGLMTVGLVCAALWPYARIGSMHLFFVSGLGLITMAVGTRVILGHAGRHDLLEGKIVWLRWVIGLVALAAATRMTSDFLPAVRISHHIYAAWTWVAAALLWLAFVGRFLLRDESGTVPIRRCSRQKSTG
jgi:uncharacterized protein involved in response to NO